MSAEGEKNFKNYHHQQKKIHSELKEGMSLAKCRKCGCMKETLKRLQASITSLQIDNSSDLLEDIQSWLKKMEEPIKYS